MVVTIMGINLQKINFTVNIILFILFILMGVVIYELRHKQFDIQEKCGL